MAAGEFEHDLHGALRIILIADAQWQWDTHIGICIAPVDHLGGDQLFIGDQRVRTVAGMHYDIAGAHFLYPAIGVAGGDDITGPDRAVHHQNKTADEITGDALQAKAEPHTQRAAENGQCR